MPNKAKIHRTGRDRAVADLVQFRADVGTLNRGIYQMAADSCGYSVRQLQRQIAKLDRPEADSAEEFTVDEDIIETVFLTCGNISGAHRRLRESGKAVPSLSTFRRRVLDTMGGTKMAYAKNASTQARLSRVHLKRTRESRGYSYLLDHTELPIFAVPEGTRTAQRPWLTAVMDAETRYILSWVLTFGTPTSEEIRAALMSAFTIRPAADGQTPVGGLPERALWDRGLDFLSDLITESCLRLSVTPVALPAYSPHLKGSLERFWRFLKSDALAPLPGYIDAGRDLRGNFLLAAKALDQQGLVNELRDWIDRYNAHHTVSTLGCTPLHAWRNDHTPLRSVPADQLWHDFLISKTHKVGKAGIRFKKTDYVAPNGELDKVFGRLVEVRHLPHDHSFIEVFHDGTHLATCFPAEALRPDDQLAFLAARHKAEAAAKATFRTANRLRGNRPDASPLTKISEHGQPTRYEVLGPDFDLRQDGQKALDALANLPDQPQGALW